MGTQQQSQPDDKMQVKEQKPKWLPQGIWITAIIVAAIIIAIIIATIWVFRLYHPDISIQIAAFSILTAIVLGLPGLMFAYFQWYYPRPSHEHKTLSNSSSSLPPNTGTDQSSLLVKDAVAAEQSMIATKQPALELKPMRPDSIFLFNVKLPQPNEFYGRVRERDTLINRTYNRASTSIIGSRRIGKSWLLEYLQLVGRTQLGSRYRICYLDATMPSCTTVAGFTTAVLQSFNISLSNASNPKLITLENVVKDLISRHQVPVLCIDEFEGFNNRKVFDLNFFVGLRALAQLGLVLVVSSRTSLIDMIGDFGKTSGFFNIFEQIKLEPFNIKETEEFTWAKCKQAGFTEQEREYLVKYGQIDILQWSPLRLQLVGKLLLGDKILSTREGSHYYRPEDSDYWEEFEKRLEDKYRGVVR